MARQKIEKVPLRHECDEFAMRRQLAEIGDDHSVAVYYTAQLTQLLMRLLQELIQQTKLVHQLQSGRMNGIAAKIAKEIGVLLQHRHGYAGSGEQIANHHSGRPTTNDHAASP